MENLEEQKINYNSIPVYYCKHCLSLLIKDVPQLKDSEFCDSCGSTDVGQCSIEEWEDMYKASHHGMRFLDSNY